MVFMAIIKKNKLREASDAELQSKLFDYQKELNTERGMLATGGRTSNPGKISELKRAVSRILTIVHERKLGIKRNVKTAAEVAKKPAAPAKQ
ncbi:50S ribosomal protein L29 [uncultured archaeon]|nr:50S ribosomal protein L29 [uncultured archaeon]